MSMNKDECLHDCTCHTHKPYDPNKGIELDCDLPEGHAGDHWDPVWGWFAQTSR